MKQLLLFCGILLTCSTVIFSQEEKKVVAIMPFVSSLSQNKGTAAQVQEMIIRVLRSNPGIELIDRSKDSLVVNEMNNQIRDVSVSANYVVSQGKISGAQQIIVGTLTHASAESVGNQNYSGLVSFSLQLIDVETGILQKQGTFEGNTKKSDAANRAMGGLGSLLKKGLLSNVSNVAGGAVMADTREKAIQNAINSSEKAVVDWINDLYPPDVKILTIETRSKGLPESILVAGLNSTFKKGTQITVSEVQFLDVDKDKKVKRLKKISELKVQELQGDVTLCKVTSGEAALEEKWKSGIKLAFSIR